MNRMSGDSLLELASTCVWGALEGPELSSEELAFFESTPCVGGVTLFKRNIVSHAQVVGLCAELHRLHPKMRIAIDQEGGRVSRLQGIVSDHGPAMHLPKREIFAYAQTLGRELVDLGIDINFAPVIDVLTEDRNTGIGDRAFGKTAEDVTERAGLFLDGLQSSGVLGCLKHFPGQGSAVVDTHEKAAHVNWTPSETELHVHPFSVLIPRAKAVMVSHAIFVTIDPDYPASLSKLICSSLLREELGFQGVLISDDLGMGAIATDSSGVVRGAVGAMAAGCDVLLVCRDLARWRGAIEALVSLGTRDTLFAKRLQEAALRVSLL